MGYGARSRFLSAFRSYGKPGRLVQRLAAAGVIAGLAGVLALTAEDSAGGAPVKIVLAGKPDPDNPASIPEATLRAWNEEGVVEWLGFVADMPGLWAASHVAVSAATGLGVHGASELKRDSIDAEARRVGDAVAKEVMGVMSQIGNASTARI